MHSFRLQCQQFKLHRCGANLLKKFVQTSIKTCCVNYYSREISSDSIENQQFKAAVLYPKKQNLTLETLVLPDKAADGMVRFFTNHCLNNSFYGFAFYLKYSITDYRFVSASITAR